MLIRWVLPRLTGFASVRVSSRPCDSGKLFNLDVPEKTVATGKGVYNISIKKDGGGSGYPGQTTA